VGETPIAGAVARMAELRARGKKLCVLTNAASYTGCLWHMFKVQKGRYKLNGRESYGLSTWVTEALP